MYWYWIYTANNWGIYLSSIYILVLDIYCQQLGNICKFNLYIWYWIYSANNWGMYVSWIYELVLDIYCQQLGDICQLEVVCAPWGWRRGVGECILCDIYTLVLYIYCQQLEDTPRKTLNLANTIPEPDETQKSERDPFRDFLVPNKFEANLWLFVYHISWDFSKTFSGTIIVQDQFRYHDFNPIQYKNVAL